MKALERVIKDDAHGIYYAVSIFFATALLWFLVHEIAKRDPVLRSVPWLPPAIR